MSDVVRYRMLRALWGDCTPFERNMFSEGMFPTRFLGNDLTRIERALLSEWGRKECGLTEEEEERILRAARDKENGL